MIGKNYREIPENEHGVSAGSILLANSQPLTRDGSSSLDFVIDQGGSPETFIFLFGVSRDMEVFQIIEGVFLNVDGPGFRPTWGFHQLCLEIASGGWEVIPVEQVLASWSEKVEARMNL